MNFLVILPFLLGFLFSLFVPVDFFFRVDWFLFGLEFRVDYIAKQFLLFTSFIWLISAVYAMVSIKENKKSYFFWFIFTYIGNLFLCISFDVISFYLFFSLMSLSSFALILHNRSNEAKNATFVYIKYAIFGEVLIFFGIINLVFTFGSFNFSNFINADISYSHLLILIGFGIKIGMFLLHSWLPLAHSNAPASASAVLSAVMLKAGILGWFRFFNSSLEYGEFLPYSLMTLGILGIFIGFYGLFQDKIKAVLAYSSISQMGFVVLIFGVAIYDTKNYDLILIAILFFITHHAFNKAAIFLLANEISKNGLNRLNLFIFFITSFSLIGLPFTSGAMAKDLLKSEVDLFFVLIALTIGSIITAILMIRFYLLSKKYEIKNENFNNSVLILPLIFVSVFLSYILDFNFSFNIWQILPLFIATIFYMVIYKKGLDIKVLPQGDILNLFNFKINNKQNLEIENKTKSFNLKFFKIIEVFLNEERYVFLVIVLILFILLMLV